MPLFTRSGDSYEPTLFTTGPWRADAQHGGPPAALLGRATEAALDDGETLARITVELVKPVPLRPLTPTVERRRVSRRVAHIMATLRCGDEIVATSTALSLSGAPLPAPGWTPSADVHEVPAPETRAAVPAFASGDTSITYHRDAVEHRMTQGRFATAGPATSWVRLLEPLVDGEVTSSLCSLLAAADFGSGISAIYDHDASTGLINADLTVALARPAVGEWIRIDSVTRSNDQGTGLAVTEIGDRDGYVGIATQSLLGLQL